MDSLPTITTESSRLAFYDCDYLKRMKLSTILKVTAELAGKDYDEKGLGYEFLRENDFVFLLSQISLHISRYPNAPEVLLASTWECGKKSASFLRGYEILSGGDVCVQGVSGWVVANISTKRIVRPSQFPWQMPQREDKPLAALPIHRLSCNGEWVGEHVVVASEIDANGHVYNANYADIAVNFLPQELFARETVDFLIDYVSETKLGEVIDIYMEKYPISNDKISGVKIAGRAGARACFCCEFHFL